jgi:hypothetical protein
VALYLPGLDLAASSAELAPEPLAAIVGAELAAVDRLLDRIGESFGAVAVLFDPGRRGGGAGRMLVWNRRCEASYRPTVDPRQAAAALIRAAGLPQSRELPAPPEFCRWVDPPSVVDGFGARPAPDPAAAEGDDYLETLRSLGYL